MSASNPDERLRIAFFGHDSNESTIRKRVAAFTAFGADVFGVMFHRTRKGVSSAPSWPNVDLGETADGSYLHRLMMVGRALGKTLRARKELAESDIIYARNLDMLGLAAVSKYCLGLSAPIVYEALDVHPIFTKGGAKSWLARFVERALLRTTSLLVVSSPTFIANYYAAKQGYAGPWHLLENKVFRGGPGAASSVRVATRSSKDAEKPWIIGWFGVLRCMRSLELLRAIATKLGTKVVIHIRGTASEPDGITDEMLHQVCRRTDNMHFFGAYDSARELDQIYGAIDIAWAVDFSAQGANSDWLIPNRIYESGLYGVPVIARKDTTTGQRVEELGMGWSFAEPFGANVETFLSELDVKDYDAKLERLQATPPDLFVDLTDTIGLLGVLRGIANRGAPDQNAEAVLRSS